MREIFSHIRVGLCWWDLVMLLILIAIIAAIIISNIYMKRKRKAVEEQLSNLYTKDIL